MDHLLVDQILADARWRGAQEVEIRRLSSCGAVRYRRANGTLHLRLRLELSELDAVVDRLKSMASLSTDKRGPQVGEMRFGGSAGPSVNLRLRTLPTSEGENLWILFPSAPDASGEPEEVLALAGPWTFGDTERAEDEQPMIRFVNRLVEDAYGRRADALRITDTGTCGIVSQRIHGEWTERTVVPRMVLWVVLNRLRDTAGLIEIDSNADDCLVVFRLQPWAQPFALAPRLRPAG